MAYNDDTYGELPVNADGEMESLYQDIQEKRQEEERGDFMSRPDDGWLHDGRGLAAGKGVYFSFPVFYLGSIHMTKSLSSFSRDDQTDITREAIARVCDEALNKGKSQRHLSPGARAFGYGRVTKAAVQVKLSISASGMIIAPVAKDGEDAGIIAFHPMRLISLASGGEKDYYDFISYVAKDKDTDKRECFVFDTGVFSDDVLSTMGQAFVLAQQLASKGGSGAHRDGNYAAIDEALRMPPGAESFYSEALDAMKEKGGSNYFDISPNAPGDSDTYFDIAPNKPGAGGGANALYMDVAPDPTGEGGDAYLDVTHSLAQMSMASKQNGTSLYDTAGSEAATQAFVQNLNANDTYLQMTADTKVKLQQHEDKGNDTYMLLAPGADSEAQKPTWDAYNPDQVRKKVDLSALRAQQAQEQSTYFDISPNAPGAGGAQDSTYFDIAPTDV